MGRAWRFMGAWDQRQVRSTPTDQRGKHLEPLRPPSSARFGPPHSSEVRSTPTGHVMLVLGPLRPPCSARAGPPHSSGVRPNPSEQMMIAPGCTVRFAALIRSETHTYRATVISTWYRCGRPPLHGQACLTPPGVRPTPTAHGTWSRCGRPALLHLGQSITHRKDSRKLVKSKKSVQRRFAGLHKPRENKQKQKTNKQ